MEMTELVELLSGNTEFKLDHHFAVLRLIDEAAQPYITENGERIFYAIRDK